MSRLSTRHPTRLSARPKVEASWNRRNGDSYCDDPNQPRAFDERVDVEKYIEPLNIQPGDLVYLNCRVSTYSQKSNENPKDQIPGLTAAVEADGGKVVGLLAHQLNGRDLSWLPHVVRKAREAGATIILAEATSRFVRHPNYKANDPRYNQLQAREVDLLRLFDAADGMRLMTLLDPNASPAQEGSFFKKRGQTVKGNKGGRPRNPEPSTAGAVKQFKLDWLPVVLELKKSNPEKWTNRELALEIEKRSGRPTGKSTIGGWLKRHWK